MNYEAVLAVNERQAAKMLSISVAALRRWRRERRGVPFVRVEKCIRYRIADLERYLETHLQALQASK